MSETDILYQITLNEELAMASLAWWGGITLGFLALLYFARRWLHRAIVVLIVLGYAAFTWVTSSEVNAYRETNSSYIDDLKGMPGTSAGTDAFVASWERGLNSRLLPSLALAVLIGGSVYLIICYLRQRRLR